MFFLSFCRSSKRRLARAIFILTVVIFLFDLLALLNQYTAFQVNLYLNKINTIQDLPHNISDEKLFIAAAHWNSADILRSHWNAAVLDIVQILGPEYVYVSIVESGSWDDTKIELQKLDLELETLNVSRTTFLDPTTHADEIGKGPSLEDEQRGWIRTSRADNRQAGHR